jgi:hypothetical protein
LVDFPNLRGIPELQRRAKLQLSENCFQRINLVMLLLGLDQHQLDYQSTLNQIKSEELKQFVHANGHDRVPLYGTDKSFGLWVERQRVLYRKFLEGGGGLRGAADGAEGGDAEGGRVWFGYVGEYK